MSPKIVDKEQKKKEILQAALKVYAGKGVKNSRIIDVAREAGIGKGTVYEYFRSADEILAASFYFLMEEMETKIRIALGKIDDPVDRLKAMLKIPYLMFSDYSADYLAIFIEFWSEGVRSKDKPSQLAIDFKQIYNLFRNQLIEIINECIKRELFRKVNAVSVASTLMAIVDGLYLQLIMDPKAFSHRQIIDDALDMALYGMMKNKGEK